METTIKQAEEDRNKALENAKHLFDEQRMLKDQLDMLRSSVGLEALLDNPSENDEKLAYKWVFKLSMFIFGA